jgi:hypothetical protein
VGVALGGGVGTIDTGFETVGLGNLLGSEENNSVDRNCDIVYNNCIFLLRKKYTIR